MTNLAWRMSMIATDTIPMKPEHLASTDLESVLWDALELDNFSDEMMVGTLADVQMGTGYTVNACNMCSSNSNTTSGCRTCC
jgi:hypothetical protein